MIPVTKQSIQEHRILENPESPVAPRELIM